MYLHISHILKLQNSISVLNVSAGFQITLCGQNINYGKTKQCVIWQLELQNWATKRNFPQNNQKRWKKNSKTKQGFGRERFTLVGMVALTSRKTRSYKEKTKSIFNREKWKKKRAVGRRISGSQQVNNSLASFRHQKGKNSTDPRPANACTSSCG